jgi:hypothetical protein
VSESFREHQLEHRWELRCFAEKLEAETLVGLPKEGVWPYPRGNVSRISVSQTVEAMTASVAKGLQSSMF